MTTRNRRLLGFIIAFLLLLLVTAGVGLWLVRKSFPRIDGTVTTSIVDAPVHIRRDAYGMAHITASSQRDAYRALGFVHGQDRLWQMELIRRVGLGRLAEIAGAEAVPVDRMFRTLGLWEIARRCEAVLDPETREAMEAYAEGVNEHIRQSQGRLPLEFDMLGIKPEPWNVQHSLLVSRLMAWELDYSRWMDVTLSVLVERFGREPAEELFPRWEDDAPLIIPRDAPSKNRSLALREFMNAEQEARRVLGWTSLGHGSNSWVVNGKRTHTGKPILANDPHLMLMTPGRFHESHVTMPDAEVAGLCIPGVPFVIIGRNRSIAWGLTNAMMDDHDFFVERVDDPIHPARYELDGQWRPLVVREDTILVRDADPIILTIYATHRGPIINRVEAGAKWSRELISMRWSGHEVSNDARTFYLLNRARTWREFRDAIEHFTAPAQNFLYADTSGNIGYQTGGRLPLRPARQALLPTPGWSSENDWKGFIPASGLPSVFNPKQGFIVAANNKIIGSTYPYHITHMWEPPWRAQRLNEVLANESLVSVEDMERLQQDVFSPLAREVVPLILATIPDTTATEHERVALAYLRTWDRSIRADAPAASIFETFYTRLISETLGDEMGPELMGIYDTVASMPLTAIQRLLRTPSSAWFDDIRTPQHESRDDIVRRSFRQSIATLEQTLGPDVKTWRWDRLHTVTFGHLFGANPLLKTIFDNGPYPVRGSHSTVSVGYYVLSDPYRMTVGSAIRQVYDLSNVNNTRSVVPPGQSGHAFHPNYHDQIPLWLNGASRIVPMDPGLVERQSMNLLVLEPDR